MRFASHCLLFLFACNTLSQRFGGHMQQNTLFMLTWPTGCWTKEMKSGPRQTKFELDALSLYEIGAFFCSKRIKHRHPTARQLVTHPLQLRFCVKQAALRHIIKQVQELLRFCQTSSILKILETNSGGFSCQTLTESV